ncbi:response regulator [Pseudomonas sp. HR96]|uniref:response regulator n=1 Tax=Pseudomonas sp. HR96 TaxID=1027966 RepID=UPI002A764977|nr:response regulator [Pseudomonas sp. HR96]WPO98249.1 response regulator [Pseudomonas sp. HR96]
MPELKAASSPTRVEDSRTPIVLPAATLRMIERVAALLCLAALAASVVVLLGYVLDRPLFITLAPTLQGMSPMTALGIALVAVTKLIPSRQARVFWWCAGAAGAIALLALAAQLLLGHDLVSEWVVERLFGASVIGRTSVATATCLALLVVAQAARRLGRPRLTDLCAALTLAIGAIAVLGYGYGVEDLYGMFLFNSMALHTALALILLSVASLLRNSQQGYAGVLFSEHPAGRVTRLQLMVACAILVIGWGLSHAIHSGLVGPAAALAIISICAFVPLVVLIIRNGRALSRLDDTRRKRAEDEGRIRADLEAQLAARVSELEEQTRQRKAVEAVISRTQRLEAVGQLTGGIAHDFNNLLMAISGNLELLQRSVPSDGKPRTYLNRAMTAAQKGSKLTAQLLAFSRTQRLSLDDLGLLPVMQAVRDLISNAMGLTIELSIEYPDPSLWVRSDGHQLELAILNLALNAKDAMPEGGSLLIRCREVAAHGRFPALVAIDVIDSGSGMSEEVLARATEPFFTTKEHGKGTGLGLAQVYGFCLQSNGDLRIDSTPGLGTVVQILLPQVEAGVCLSSSPDAQGAASPASLNRQVLVVDDDDSVRSVFVDALRLEGYQVLEAADGFSALRVLNDVKPAVAIFDFLMPGLNGAELARKARARQPDLPIVFISGYSDTLALDSIADAMILRKPIDLQTLRGVVAEMARVS